MEYTTLGGSGLRVPRIALGCGEFGRRPDRRDAVRIVETALDMSITLFDTADVYNDGESERILGEAVRNQRERCVLATKFRHLASAPGGSRRSIRIALEGTLKRLGTDYVDLYQMHAPDPSTPIEETIATLQDLVREGKVLYFGLCNVKAWQAVDAQHTAWALGGAPLVSVQSQMNVLDLSAFLELRPVVGRFELGLLSASPLARGLLGGTYSQAHLPPKGHRLLTRKGAGYWNERGLAVAERIRAAAERLNRKPAQLALEVLLSFEEVSSVLVGASSLEQLRDLGEVRFGELDKLTVRDLIRGGLTAVPDDPALAS
jgi:1-deoxyxylulose-5-phosphate synthase